MSRHSVLLCPPTIASRHALLQNLISFASTMPLFDEFRGANVIVTGAGRGIGKAIAVRLHQIGATVCAISKNPKNLDELKSQCSNIQTVAVDLSDWKATRAAIEALPVAEYLVNNAGVLVTKSFRDTSEEDLDWTFGVNVKAIFNVSQVFVSKLVAAGKPGSIVNISSVGAVRPAPPATAYSTSKAAVDHLTRNMALELGPLKIRVNAISPGPVITDMLMQGIEGTRAQNPELNMDAGAMFSRLPLEAKSSPTDDIVNATLFLLSHKATSTAVGTNLAVDCGFRLV